MQVQNNLANRGPKNVTQFKVGNDDVTLSPDIVRSYLVSGNGRVTDQEVTFFIHLCRGMRLNPFLKEAYLIKYSDKQVAQTVVSKEAFLKRAEHSEEFDGYDAGIIIFNSEGQIEYRRGTFYMKNREELVGGWAEVYKKNRSRPYRSDVSLDEYIGRKNDGTVNSMWSSKPATMIRKVALSQALREAFPDDLSQLYTEEEMEVNEPLNVAPIQQLPVEMYQEPQQIQEQVPQQFVQPEETYSEPVMERPSFV